jgi:hypothetical protein
MTTMAAMNTVTTKFRLGLAAFAIAIVAFVSVVPAVAPPVHAVPATHVLVPAAPIGPLPLQTGICTVPGINLACAFVGFFDAFIDPVLSFLPFGIGAEGGFLDQIFDLFLPFAPYEP